MINAIYDSAEIGRAVRIETVPKKRWADETMQRLPVKEQEIIAAGSQVRTESGPNHRFAFKSRDGCWTILTVDLRITSAAQAKSMSTSSQSKLRLIQSDRIKLRFGRMETSPCKL